MKITGVIFEDKTANVCFGFIKQFPGICAQAPTFEEVDKKINSYYKAFIEKISNEHVEFDKENIETLAG